MMHYLCNMIAYFLFWLVGGAFNNNQIPDATSSFVHVSDPSAVHHAGSNQPHEDVKEDVELNNQFDKCVCPDENDRTEESIVKVTSCTMSYYEIDNKEESNNSDTGKNNKSEESKDTEIDTSVNDSQVINELNNVHPASYSAYFPECDKVSRNNNITLSSDDEESIEDYDPILESPPLYQPECPSQRIELPDFPALHDIEPTTDLDLAIKAGPIPRLCTYCFRWEDQPDDKYEKKDMVSDKWFMFGNIVFFRKRKPFWAQCSACGFGMPKKVVRGRRIHRMKRLFCKISGREYKGYEFKRYEFKRYEFKRFGYEWMGEKGRNEGLSTYM